MGFTRIIAVAPCSFHAPVAVALWGACDSRLLMRNETRRQIALSNVYSMDPLYMGDPESDVAIVGSRAHQNESREPKHDGRTEVLYGEPLYSGPRKDNGC